MATSAASLRFVVEFVHPNINPVVRIVGRNLATTLGGWHALEHRLNVQLEPGTEIAAADFLTEVEMSRFDVRRNKHVAIVPLPTWYWVAVVGDNGEMRGKPRLVRHTLAAPGHAPARWEVWGEDVPEAMRTKYVLRRPAQTESCSECGREIGSTQTGCVYCS